MKGIIVDDEKNSRETLLNLIENYCDVRVDIVECVDNVKDAIDAIHTHHPNVVFLDIQLKAETGFNLLELIGDDKINFEIIFTTAYDDKFARQALRFSSHIAGYLTKPVNINELNKAIKNISKESTPVKSRIKIDDVNHKTSFFVEPEDILYIESDRANSTIVCLSRNIYTNKSIGKFESEVLSNHKFYRIHHSYLVNINQVKSFDKDGVGGAGSVLMSNNDELPLSVGKVKGFFKLFNK
ncbi:MAG: response regulator [Flavobacteriales bacterium]|nr:response regulator [Flavobacteriales bacterium]